MGMCDCNPYGVALLHTYKVLYLRLTPPLYQRELLEATLLIRLRAYCLLLCAPVWFLQYGARGKGLARVQPQVNMLCTYVCMYVRIRLTLSLIHLLHYLLYYGFLGI